MRRGRELAATTCDAYLDEPRWYQTPRPRRRAAGAIAYFSPEFGITAVLPQYSGGLGILAGDHLKAASRPRRAARRRRPALPAGYFRQSLSRDGWQQETYPVLDPDGLPLTLLREADGTPAQVTLAAARRAPAAAPRSGAPRSAGCRCCCWTPTSRATTTAARGVTDRLYGGGGEHRLQQELLLGIGGVRALRVYAAAHRRPGAGGVPHQRGPRRLPRARADPRADRRPTA